MHFGIQSPTTPLIQAFFERMALAFQEQITLMSRLVEAPRLTICIGSGVSRRRLPLLNDLIALAFRNIPLTHEAREVFLGFSQFYSFHALLAALGVATADPCTLEEFRSQPNETQSRLCHPLTPNYGDVFAALQGVAGSKRALLDCIEFQQFEIQNSDAAHFYIGFLILEGVVDRLLTTNWDRLVEFAVQASTSQPLTDVLGIIRDQASWLDRNEGAYVSIAKVHGCSTQYPDHCENIILTTPELQLATGASWSRDAVDEFISGMVLFSGYSASDYTLMVPLRVLAALRAQNALDSSHFFIAQETDLNPAGRDLTNNDADRHLRLWANDTFASLYFAYLQQRLLNAITTAEQQRRPERAFPNWEEAAWQALIPRLRALTTEQFGAFLDSVIGDPGARPYDERAARLPIEVSALRAIFLTGRLAARDKYQNIQFDANKDIVLLVLLAALVDLILGAGGRISLETSYAGLTIVEDNGSRRKLIFLYGVYVNTAYPSLSAYLTEIEDSDGQFPEFEVAVIPCSRYDVPDEAFPVNPILAKALPGTTRARRRFVDPRLVFATRSYDDLVTNLRTILEM
jgi:hypothetical protein